MRAARGSPGAVSRSSGRGETRGRAVPLRAEHSSSTRPRVQMSRWSGLRVESEGTGISRPLSEQVNLLGEMLGQVIREEAGEAVFARVEELRLLCKRAAAEDEPALRERAAEIVRGLGLEEIVWLVRSFTAFFHLAN